MYLIMELCEQGELADLLKAIHHFKEKEAQEIIKQLANAISYLHKNDIVHRDLKLENILVQTNPDNGHLQIKVTDFGLSVFKDGVGHENMMQQFCGTPIYMPPEIVDNKTYSQQCDVWAMGVITYYLLAGMPPFRARDEETLYEYIKKADVDCGQEFIKDCSSAAHACIKGMLKVDPAHRLTASEVLHHHWITGMSSGSSSANVLELMKQWKDDLTSDEEEGTTAAPETAPDELSSSPSGTSKASIQAKSSQPKSGGITRANGSSRGGVQRSPKGLSNQSVNNRKSPQQLSGAQSNLETTTYRETGSAGRKQSLGITPAATKTTVASNGHKDIKTTRSPTSSSIKPTKKR